LTVFHDKSPEHSDALRESMNAIAVENEAMLDATQPQAQKARKKKAAATKQEVDAPVRDVPEEDVGVMAEESLEMVHDRVNGLLDMVTVKKNDRGRAKKLRTRTG
jgi:hypothetical protein